MPYVQSFEDFALHCKLIFNDSPTKARYTVKHRSDTKELVLKITDDTHVIIRIITREPRRAVLRRQNCSRDDTNALVCACLTWFSLLFV